VFPANLFGALGVTQAVPRHKIVSGLKAPPAHGAPMESARPTVPQEDSLFSTIRAI